MNQPFSVDRNLSWQIFDRQEGYQKGSKPEVIPVAEVAIRTFRCHYTYDGAREAGDRVVRGEEFETLRFTTDVAGIKFIIAHLLAIVRSLEVMGDACPEVVVNDAGSEEPETGGEGEES